jgi:biopolymer transport protein ExbD
MIRVPTSRLRKRTPHKMNLTSIMDSIFILIFFLMMEVNFLRIMEIGTELPIVSDVPPPPQKDPLALQLTVKKDFIELSRGLNAVTVDTFKRLPDGNYELNALHERLVKFKIEFPSEKSILFTPDQEVSYDDLVKIMDAVRRLEKTDEAIYIKDQEGLDIKVEELFGDIIFTNLMS